MVIQTSDFSMEGSDVSSATIGWADQLLYYAGNRVFKSGPLFVLSKGIGWATWKRRWFILTCTSLIFFRRNPGSAPQKGGDVNLALGGIALNSSGSVVVKADKKLLTVIFPDGGDGRAFTLKAENLEDLNEWKDALEDALAQAPNVALITGHSSIFKNELADGIHVRSKHPVNSLVISRPIPLALEDVNGAPSFLEKALRFLEQYGVKTEGIFRQSASVDDVARRVQEYEQGDNEFSPDEDPHVVADCIKCVLRELPSSLMPAPCCSALLKAYRSQRGVRVNAIREALYETLPEPNHQLLKRILLVMQAVASHKSENRMSLSAVAACMAPLVLRPLVAGNCELENGFDSSGNGSLQFLKAAAAANHAQAILITLLEEYGSIFETGSISSELSEPEETGSEIEEPNEILKRDGYHEAENQTEMEAEGISRGNSSKISGRRDDDVLSDSVGSEDTTSSYATTEIKGEFESTQGPETAPQISYPQNGCKHSSYNLQDQSDTCSEMQACISFDSSGNVPGEINLVPNLTGCGPSSCFRKSKNKSNNPVAGVKQYNKWGHIHARKNHSLESVDYDIEDEVAIHQLEDIKTNLQNRIAEEAKGNAILQGSLERRKQALQECRSALEQDVARLKKLLQQGKDLREALEAGMQLPCCHSTISATNIERMNADLVEILPTEADLKQQVEDLHVHILQQLEINNGLLCVEHTQPPYRRPATLNDKQKDAEIPLASHLNESIMRIKMSNNRKRNIRLQELLMVPNSLSHEQQDINMSSTSIERVKKQVTHLSIKQLLHKQQRSLPDHDNIISSWCHVTSPVEALVEPAASSTSRKFSLRNEVNPQQSTISTSSFALTKLTSRLNFLKEKRIQIAKDVQNFDKSLESNIKEPTPTHKSEGHTREEQFLKPYEQLFYVNSPVPGNLTGFASHIH